jgi:hypothetical protein
MLVRVVVLFACGGYLFYRWTNAPRRYFSDIPFLMGVSFTALAASKIFDIYLYSTFLDSDVEAMNPSDPAAVLAYARWLVMLAVISPLLYASLNIWLAGRSRLRAVIVGANAIGFVLLILGQQSYAGLNALTPFMVFPPAVLTVVTFLFTYWKKRLPNVYGLLVGVGWIGYIISSIIRPTLILIGPPPWGLVVVSELIDMVLWLVIFLGFVLRPKYAQKAKVPSKTSGIESESEYPLPLTSL